MFEKAQYLIYRFYLFIFTEWGREGESEGKKHLTIASCAPATQTSALTRIQTGGLLVCGMMPNPLSHTSQDCSVWFECKDYFGYFYIKLIPQTEIYCLFFGPLYVYFQTVWHQILVSYSSSGFKSLCFIGLQKPNKKKKHCQRLQSLCWHLLSNINILFYFLAVC